MARKSEDGMGGMLYWAAIGGAIWFAYRWAVGSGMIPDYIGIAGDVVPPVQPQYVPPDQQVGAGASNDTGQGAGSNVPAGGTGGAGGNVKDQVWNAAKSEANANGGKLNFWQWNYYLPNNLPAVDPFAVPPSQWPGGNKPADAVGIQSTPLTIDQWWGMVKGPMGLGGGMGTVNHWGQQSSLWPGAIVQ